MAQLKQNSFTLSFESLHLLSGDLQIVCCDVVVAHLVGNVNEAVEIVGIVKGLLAVREGIHRTSLSFFASGCFRTAAADSFDQRHLFADGVDVGKALKDTAL